MRFEVGNKKEKRSGLRDRVAKELNEGSEARKGLAERGLKGMPTKEKQDRKVVGKNE